MDKLFFQSSMPRSGSTLLQNILAQNPDIYATPTSGVLELVYGARANYTSSLEFKAQDSQLMKNGFLEFCNKGVKGFYEGITDKKYVVDKSRGWGIHYDFLNSFSPNPKIICMVRNLKDVFASMEKNFRKNPEKHNPMVDWSTMSGTSIPKRVDVWAQGVPVGMALERLQEIFRLGNDKHILFVRFEDLCLYPENTMKEIYDYLEIPHFFHDFDNIEQVTKEDDEVYGEFGDHNIRQKLEVVPSKAKDILGKEVVNWIYNKYPWYNEAFRYNK
jgi:sulfotransferase